MKVIGLVRLCFPIVKPMQSCCMEKLLNFDARAANNGNLAYWEKIEACLEVDLHTRRWQPLWIAGSLLV